MNSLPQSQSGWLALPQLTALRALGADATSFLQGQLTQDVAGLPATRCALAGYCSPKGRLLASFWIWRAAPDDITLICSADLAAATLKRLSMFVMRAKCKLHDDTAAQPLMALFGTQVQAVLRQTLGAAAPEQPFARWSEGGLTVVRLPGSDDPGYLLAGPEAHVRQRWPELDAFLNQAPLPAAAWSARMVAAGLPWIVAATSEQFVPQMVNLELLQGVNFQKGCYPGQEVVARSQYRGTLKRRMLRFAVQAPAQAGVEVFHSADPSQPSGLVVDAAAVGLGADTGWHDLLVEIKTAGLAEGQLHLGSPTGAALEARPLPYDIPELLAAHRDDTVRPNA